jgi:hypothetical protein
VKHFPGGPTPDAANRSRKLPEAPIVVSYAPDNQLQSAPTLTDGRSVTTRWWNAWYTAFTVFLGAFATYIVFVIGRISHGLTDAAPRPWNAIVLTALSLGAVLSYLAAGRLNQRRNEVIWRAAVLAAIHTAASQPSRPDEEPTVPLAGRVYAAAASVAVAAVQPSADTLLKEVEDRMVDKIEDFGQREWWRGFNVCAQNGLDGVGADVVRLPGARERTTR